MSLSVGMYALFVTEAVRFGRVVSCGVSVKGGACLPRFAALLDARVVSRFEGVVQALN